jgi:hypothetical protein
MGANVSKGAMINSWNVLWIFLTGWYECSKCDIGTF